MHSPSLAFPPNAFQYTLFIDKRQYSLYRQGLLRGDF